MFGPPAAGSLYATSVASTFRWTTLLRRYYFHDRDCFYIILLPCRPVSSNSDTTFVMLNKSRICLLAFTTSSRHPRVRAETCSVTTAPNPELSIIGTSFKSKTMRPFFPHASSISIFSSGTFSLVNLP